MPAYRDMRRGFCAVTASFGSGAPLFEPIHGSAPDIAGQQKANPIAAILSAAMLLRFSCNLKQEAEAVEAAVEQVVNAGYRTEDLREAGKEIVSTQEMGKLIAEAIR